MPSFTFCEPVATGATCQLTFHPSKPCFTIFAACVSRALGCSCFGPFTEQNAKGKEEIPT